MSSTDSGFGQYPLRYAALGLLISGPRHGYALHQAFEQHFSGIWKAGQTKFYLVLTALLEEGYLEATTEPQENRPARKVYHLTDAGNETFRAWLGQPVRSLRALRVELLARLRFYDLLGLPGAGELIDRQIALLQAMIDEWEESARQAAPDGFPALVGDFRRRQARAVIDWLEASRPYFEKNG